MCKPVFIFLFLLACLFAMAQPKVDVLHYTYALSISDASDTLKGTATITIKFPASTDRFFLNLASVKEGKGMQVTHVAAGDTMLSFSHRHDTLFIQFPKSIATNDIKTITITYAGIPADGLIISKNKWGDRTFFADNWPDRAHQWIPCNDRPDDKATVSFAVTAPAQYKVISNGVLLQEEHVSPNQNRTVWNESKPVPTKVMVIGAARFAVKQFADSSITPVAAWVYPQDSTKGFYDYELATSIVNFFADYIGPYPFEKLANVQSKTIFGGMENASCIFYAENTVTGTRRSEALLAHEIAHQWFGNSATEKSFAHLWLSEGFATYLTHLYLEQKYGRDTLVNRLQNDRREIIQFAKQWPYPLVDSTSALMDLLNANSYQKGGWVLHMLRREVGDSLFRQVIRTYYNRYKYSNADTWDFEKVAEAVTKKNLKPFFQQWLFTPGVPQLEVTWTTTYDSLAITVRQKSKEHFMFPLTIGVIGADKKMTPYKLEIKQASETFLLPSHVAPASNKAIRIVLDPDTDLLFEGTVVEKH